MVRAIVLFAMNSRSAPTTRCKVWFAVWQHPFEIACAGIDSRIDVHVRTSPFLGDCLLGYGAACSCAARGNRCGRYSRSAALPTAPVIGRMTEALLHRSKYVRLSQTRTSLGDLRLIATAATLRVPCISNDTRLSSEHSPECVAAHLRTGPIRNAFPGKWRTSYHAQTTQHSEWFIHVLRIVRRNRHLPQHVRYAKVPHAEW